MYAKRSQPVAAGSEKAVTASASMDWLPRPKMPPGSSTGKSPFDLTLAYSYG